MKKIIFLLCFCTCVSAQIPTITDYTKNMNKYVGFFTFYWEDNTGELFLEIANLKQEFLYVNYLTTGLGSNDIGLDRGQLGANRVVYFEKVGAEMANSLQSL